MAMAEPQAVSNGVANNAPVPMEAEKSDPLTEAIEKIIIACEGRNDSRSSVFEAPSDKKAVDRTGGGSLRSQELAQLSRLCAAASSSPSTSFNAEKLDFGAVEGEVLASLFQLLEEHVRSAAKVDLVGEACQALEPGNSENERVEVKNMTVEKWLKGSPESPTAGPGMKRILVLKNGLEAASILVSIMTAPGVDRRIVSEDCIDACIALTRQHLSKNIVPAIGHTGHITAQSATEPTPKKPKKSPKKSETKEQRLMRNLKQVYKHILPSSDLFLGLLEQLDRLIISVPLEDRMSLTLATSALSVFAVEPAASAQSAEARLCHLLHVASISLLTNIFQRYRQHQTIIIEDLFPLMLKLPTSKRSLRTFIIHTETDASAVTVNRALFHSIKDSGQEQHCIQAITVLILSLIQCCVEMPSFQDATTEQTGLPQLKSGLGQCQAVCNFFAAQLLQRCARKGEDGGASEYRPILGNLVDDLLLLLLSPEYPGAEMLLLTLNRVLFNDVLKASSIVPKTAQSSNVEVTYLTTAFDVLGKIQAAAAGILAAYKAKPLKISKSENDDKPADNGVTENSCHCGRSNIQAFMVNCDDCKGWYHGECVAITKNNVPHLWVCDDCRLKEMVVEETRAFAQRSHRNQPEGVTGSLSECVSDTHILRQLLLNHMTEESNTSDSPAEQYARHVHLAQWIEEMCASQNSATESNDAESTKAAFVSRLLCDHFLQQWDVPQAPDCLAAKNDHTVGSSSRRCLNKEGNARLMLNLTATKSTLVLSFPNQLGLLLKLMADESQTSVRKMAVKAISQVLEADPMLMLHRSVKAAVAQRFADDAKSVREASVGLVGTFVVKSPAIANAFHSSLLKCLSDDGVSVKKRAVKIFRDVLLSNPLYKGRAMACAVMLRQASDPKEDDSVRDLIYAFFTELWLESDPSMPVPNYNGANRLTSDPTGNEDSLSHANGEAAAASPIAGAGIVTPLTPHSSSAIEPKDTAQGDKKKRRNAAGPCSPRQTRGFLAAEQMVEVVMAAESKEVLSSLLKELMCEFTDADKDRKASERQKRTVALRSHCAHLVDALMEQLLALEENQPSPGNSFGKKLVALFRAIAVFGEIANAEVLRHLDSITPYLKADNSVAHEQESQIVSEICELIFRLAPLMSSRDILRLTDGAVIDDLVSVTYRFGSGPLSSSMRALANLAKHTAADGDSVISKKLMKLVGTFYSYLLKNKQSERDFSKADVKTRNNISRALSVLGAFCRNHEVDEEDWPEMEDVDDIEAQELTPTTVMYACYSLFVYYLQQDDVDTKCAALRALTGIFISRPRVMLMLEQDRTIEEIMSPKSPIELQLESLRCWKEILLAEEKRVDSGDAKARMKAKAGMTLSKQISGDLDGDATLVGGVIGQHAPRLFKMTSSQDHRVRLASVDLLGNLLRMGLLNPMETVPYLFAVQGDVQAAGVRALALRLLIIEGEKRPEMLRQRGLAGVKQAYKFQRTVYPSKEATAVVKRKRGKNFEVECIFGCVFKECIRSSKKQRLGLYRSLLGLFTFDPADDEQFGRPKKSADKKKDQDLPLLSFAAQLLAHLPYNTATDPLFIIHHLSGTAAIQGAQLLDRLSSFLRQYSLSSSDELDNNHGEDALELAAKAKSPSRNKEISAINNADFDVEQFAELCGEACAIVLLLRLKLFLRKVYNLSETRCLEYSPDAKERICDQKHISASADMPMFNASLEMNIQKQKSKSHDKDALIRQYAEFRKLMRAEQSADHARMTDSEGEPTPPSRKRKSSEAS